MIDFTIIRLPHNVYYYISLVSNNLKIMEEDILKIHQLSCFVGHPVDKKPLKLQTKNLSSMFFSLILKQNVPLFLKNTLCFRCFIIVLFKEGWNIYFCRIFFNCKRILQKFHRYNFSTVSLGLINHFDKFLVNFIMFNFLS